MSEKITTVLLTGIPGVGKTTLVRKVCEELQLLHRAVEGFYTEEVRSDGRRIGFDIVTLEGRRSILAREHSLDMLHRPKLGKYAIFISDFEELALPVLNTRSCELLVIDEIGKMELMSKKFEAAVSAIVHTQPILATIPITSPRPNALMERQTTKIQK